MVLSKDKREIYWRKAKGFLEEYNRNRIGKLGLGMLLIFIGMAVFADWLTPYDPILTRGLAESFAMPEWVTMFHENRNLPRTMNMTVYWSYKGIDPAQAYNFVNILEGKEIAIKYVAKEPVTTDIYMGFDFDYPYDPPESFNAELRWSVRDVKSLKYSMDLKVINPDGNETLIWRLPPSTLNQSGLEQIDSSDYHLISRLGYEPGVHNLADITFKKPGKYTLFVRIRLEPTDENPTCTLTITEARFTIPGLVHGLLGADWVGADIFTQITYGARISLLIGLLAAAVGTFIGIAWGIISGYVGGGVDEIMMRIVDILLCLPVLPLLLALVFLFGKNVWYIIILIAIFGWQGLARIVRSQVLSLRETTFVECARAAGGSKLYIMFRHLVPNIFPIAFASFVLRVPGAILTEAALSFLGFGDPTAPTWGRMLHAAHGSGAFAGLAWWVILPPGMAITGICLAFVFMGHAVDEIINPRLRRRK